MKSLVNQFYLQPWSGLLWPSFLWKRDYFFCYRKATRTALLLVEIYSSWRSAGTKWPGKKEKGKTPNQARDLIPGCQEPRPGHGSNIRVGGPAQFQPSHPRLCLHRRGRATLRLIHSAMLTCYTLHTSIKVNWKYLTEKKIILIHLSLPVLGSLMERGRAACRERWGSASPQTSTSHSGGVKSLLVQSD